MFYVRRNNKGLHLNIFIYEKRRNYEIMQHNMKTVTLLKLKNHLFILLPIENIK